MLDKAFKLLILKSHLWLKIASHLSISAECFDTALEILSSKYLDERYLVEQIFVTIDPARPLPSIRDFFAEMKYLFYELNNSFSLNFLKEGMPCNCYFRHMMIHKLPMFLRKEIFRAVGHTYPSLEEIFDLYSVFRVMELTKVITSHAEDYKSKTPRN